MYLATLGKQGLRGVAELCYHKSHYAAAQVAALPKVTINPQAHSKPFFKEFVVQLPRPVRPVNEILLNDFGIVGGFDLGEVYEDHSCHALIAVTEMVAKADIDRLVVGLGAAIR